MKTIVILKSGEGSYDSYTENIDSVWAVNRKDFDFYNAFLDWLIEKLNTAGYITYRRNPPNQDSIDYTHFNKKQLKEINKVLKPLTPEVYLQSINAKKVSFSEYIS